MKKIIDVLKYKFRSTSFLGSNLKFEIYKRNLKLFENNGIKICYNRYIRQQYDPSKKNVLLAIESPAVIEDRKWLDPNMNFIAEISFANFYKLDNYLCCRDLYVNNDNHINVPIGTLFRAKQGLVSIVCSDKKKLTGHKLRYHIIEKYGDKLEVFGSGFQKYGDINSAFTDFKFQIAIENGKYPEYVSEKFFDCIKTQTIPIYWGGETAIKKMGFDTRGMFFFDSPDELDDILGQLNSKLYQKMNKYALTNLSRLIELRNEKKLNQYLNSVMFGYMHTTESFSGNKHNFLNLLPEIEKFNL